MPASDANGRGPLVGDLAAAALIAVAAATMPRTAAAPAERADPGPATTKDGWLGRLDLAQQRHRLTSFPIAVLRKFGDDRGGRLAALIAYYGFFSVFPAMLAFVTTLGFVLERDPGLRADIAGSAVAQFPVVGESIAASVSTPLAGNPLALVVGLLGALWAGMGTVQACQDAMNEVWAVERVEYPGFVGKRLRSAAMLALLGTMFVVSTGLTQLIQILELGVFGAIGVFAASLSLDVALFCVAYRLLTVADVSWRDVFPGAAFAGSAYVALQYVGGLYVNHTVNGATDTYGTFAVVIGMLSWIFLIAQVLMLGAEVNTVAARRMWPRSLFGQPATAGDRRSHAAQATSQRMDRAMDVDVDFHPVDPDRPAP
jgi:YihY family inner membrane protein